MMLEEELRAELVRISIKTYDRKLVRGTGGNVSARLDQNHMLITPSGVALCDTTIDSILKVNIETGQWISNDPYIPSKEFRLHAAIYRTRPDVNGIIHSHSPYATAYAVRKMNIPYVTDAAFKQPPMPRVDFAPSGSDDLVEKVAQIARKNHKFRAILLDEHGIIAVGAELVEAYNVADLTEEMAQIACISSIIPD